MNAYLALGISIILGVIGQICLKAGAVNGVSFGALLFQPFLLAGLGLYFISALFYIASVRVLPLSVAFPSVSASYVIVALLAHFIWHEPFGVRQFIAMLCIGCGVLLLAQR